MLKRIPYIFLCLLLAILLVFSSVPAYPQVVHENPVKLSPSTDITVEDELNFLIDVLQIRIETISVDLKNKNFKDAKDEYKNLDNTVNQYQGLLWRMNLSDSVYESIAGNVNFTRDQMDVFIQNSEIFNQSFEQYNQSISSGNATGDGITIGKVRLSYEQLTAAYDRLRANTTAIEKILTDNDIDTARFENSLVNIDNYMIDLNAEYNGAGATNSSDLRLTIEPVTPSLDDSVKISTTLLGANGVSYDGSTVNIYFNSVIIGSYTADVEGFGSMSYVIPVNSSNDVIYAHAEAIPKDRNQSRAFSNVIILHIPDKQTKLTFVPDKSTISYGDPVHFTGSLKAVDGMSAPGKNITIYLNDNIVGNAFTDKNGTYNFTYNVTTDARAGKNNFYAKYERRSGNVFLGSTSTSHTLDIVSKYTELTLGDGMHFNVGDIGHVKGSLKAEDNIPVKGASILVYVDGIKMGNNTTDINGLYNIVIRIPDNATVGTHELYTTFQPESNSSLKNSTSNRQSVSFENSIETVTVSSLPFIVFQWDTLNVNGTLSEASGLPIPDREFNITASGINIGTFATDNNGNFNASYWITGNETIGYYTISINELSDEGAPPVNRYTGHIFLIPYTKFPSLGASVIVLIIVIVVAVFIIRSRRVIRIPEQVIIDSITEPVAISDTMALQPVGMDTLPLKDIAINTGSPVPFTAMPMRIPSSEEKPPFEQSITRKTLPTFNIENEVRSIKMAIRAGNLKEAMTSIYVASRNIALIHNIDVLDSMTHKEFSSDIAGKYPSLSEPLSYIIYPYEIVTFAGREANETELNTAVNGLKEFYLRLEKEVGED